jgi:hypothetical protein
LAKEAVATVAASRVVATAAAASATEAANLAHSGSTVKHAHSGATVKRETSLQQISSAKRQDPISEAKMLESKFFREESARVKRDMESAQRELKVGAAKLMSAEKRLMEEANGFANVNQQASNTTVAWVDGADKRRLSAEKLAEEVAAHKRAVDAWTKRANDSKQRYEYQNSFLKKDRKSNSTLPSPTPSIIDRLDLAPLDDSNPWTSELRSVREAWKATLEDDTPSNKQARVLAKQQMAAAESQAAGSKLRRLQAELELDKALSDGSKARERAEKYRKLAEDMQHNITQLITHHAGEVIGAQLAEQVKAAVAAAEVAFSEVEAARSHLKNLSGGVRKGSGSSAEYKAATFAVAQKQARADAAETKAIGLMAKANARFSEASALARGSISLLSQTADYAASKQLPRQMRPSEQNLSSRGRSWSLRTQPPLLNPDSDWPKASGARQWWRPMPPMMPGRS